MKVGKDVQILGMINILDGPGVLNLVPVRVDIIVDDVAEEEIFKVHNLILDSHFLII